MFTAILPYLGMFAAFVGTVITAFAYGHSKGKAKAETANAVADATVGGAQSTAAAEAKLQAEKDARNVQDRTSNLDSNAIADSLQQYTRDESGSNDAGKV